MEKYNLDKLWQLVFAAGIAVLILLFYLTRIAPISANGDLKEQNYQQYKTAYEFEQEEQKLVARINALKSEYAAVLFIYKKELESIENSQYSLLEIREKKALLNQIYSDDFFQKKLDLIDEEKKKLDLLLSEKCRIFCVIDDLPDDLK
jgi:hypothetical protein